MPQFGACPASICTQSPQGLPQLLLPWDGAQDKCFKSATPEKTSRCLGWGSLKAVQVLEVLLRVLQGASLHRQAPEEPVPQSLKLCEGAEEPRAPPVVKGQTSTVASAAPRWQQLSWQLRPWALNTARVLQKGQSGNEGCLVLHPGLARRRSGGSSQAVGALLRFTLLSQM